MLFQRSSLFDISTGQFQAPIIRLLNRMTLGKGSGPNLSYFSITALVWALMSSSRVPSAFSLTPSYLH